MALYLRDLEEDEDPYAYADADAAGRALTWSLKIMGFIANRTGLINWEDQDVYKFSHRSLQE